MVLDRSEINGFFAEGGAYAADSARQSQEPHETSVFANNRFTPRPRSAFLPQARWAAVH
jgi:hypothetical protein